MKKNKNKYATQHAIYYEIRLKGASRCHAATPVVPRLRVWNLILSLLLLFFLVILFLSVRGADVSRTKQKKEKKRDSCVNVVGGFMGVDSGWIYQISKWKKRCLTKEKAKKQKKMHRRLCLLNRSWWATEMNKRATEASVAAGQLVCQVPTTVCSSLFLIHN